MRLSTYLENGVSVCREHHNVCSFQRKIAQENEKKPSSVLKSYLRFDLLFSFKFLVISFLLWSLFSSHLQGNFIICIYLFVLWSAEQAETWAGQVCCKSETFHGSLSAFRRLSLLSSVEPLALSTSMSAEAKQIKKNLIRILNFEEIMDCWKK